MSIIKQNWFNRYTEAREILREAGWKENIATGILAAIFMVFGGSTLKAAAERNNIKIEDLLKAMQDRPTVEKVYRVYSQEKIEPKKTIDIQKPYIPINHQITKPKIDIHPQVDFNDLIQTILKHESLIKGQTPFRITNPIMKKWNTIHGFEIDKNPRAPSDRKNFLFLKNPNEVPLAVRKQFENYAHYPQKYGLPKNPTLEDALKLFDQTGAKGKIDFIKKQFPFVDLSIPLASLLAS